MISFGYGSDWDAWRPLGAGRGGCIPRPARGFGLSTAHHPAPPAILGPVASRQAPSHRLRLGNGIIVVSLFASTACGWGTEPKTPDARIRRDTRIVHEECDTDAAGARSHDVNGDGRGDLRILYSGERELCRSLDLNFDGRVDAWIYRSNDGQIRRRESDFDRDGRIDEIAMFSTGNVASKQIATNLAGRLDTWHYYERGVLKRSERDSDGDSVVDQWWEFPRTPASECALVHSDVDGDGRPDPGATVDLCKDETAAAATPATTTSAAPPPAPAPPATASQPKPAAPPPRNPAPGGGGKP
jgi:hypothetical protein